MNLEQFISECGFSDLSETERACHLAFFFLKTKAVQTFKAQTAAKWLVNIGGASPNVSRLDQNLRSSSRTVKAGDGFRLTGEFIRELERSFPELSEKSQEVIDDGTILPPIDYENTRGYIENLAKQINASYEQNIFDGCAVLMRRLVEVLLILSYQKLNIEAVIKNSSGNYKMLESLIDDAKTNGTLRMSRNSKECLDAFRELGNFSAHKIEYTCRREYIRPVIQQYRALVVELLHKAGIRT